MYNAQHSQAKLESEVCNA